MHIDQSSVRSGRRAALRFLGDSAVSPTTLRIGPGLCGLDGMARIFSPGPDSIAKFISVFGSNLSSLRFEFPVTARSRASTSRGQTMNRYVLAASTLSSAVGLALAMQAAPIQAQGMMDSSKMPKVVQDNMMRMEKNHLEKCYGINKVAKNDCAEGAHSCAGQATQARDFKSFVLLPAGDCSKIQGGKTTA